MSTNERNDMPLWRAIGRLPNGAIVKSSRFRAVAGQAAETIGLFRLALGHGPNAKLVSVELLEHGRTGKAKDCDLMG